MRMQPMWPQRLMKRAATSFPRLFARRLRELQLRAEFDLQNLVLAELYFAELHAFHSKGDRYSNFQKIPLPRLLACYRQIGEKILHFQYHYTFPERAGQILNYQNI